MTKARHIEPLTSYKNPIYSALTPVRAFDIRHQQKTLPIYPYRLNVSPHQIIFSVHISSDRLGLVVPGQKAEVAAK